MDEDLYEKYMDGTVAKEVRELIFLYAHPDTTVREIERLVHDFHRQMADLYDSQLQKRV